MDKDILYVVTVLTLYNETDKIILTSTYTNFSQIIRHNEKQEEKPSTSVHQECPALSSHVPCGTPTLFNVQPKNLLLGVLAAAGAEVESD